MLFFFIKYNEKGFFVGVFPPRWGYGWGISRAGISPALFIGLEAEAEADGRKREKGGEGEGGYNSARHNTAFVSSVVWEWEGFSHARKEIPPFSFLFNFSIVVGRGGEGKELIGAILLLLPER